MVVTNTSNQVFLEELRQQWSQNPVIATLMARLRPMDIPTEIIQLAGNMQHVAQQSVDSFHAHQQFQDAINARLGAMGIWGGSNSFNSGLNFGTNDPDPDELLFYGTLAEIRAHNGDPPAVSGMREQAVAVLRGQIDPMQACIAAGVQLGGGQGQILQGLLPMLNTMFGGCPPIFQRMAIVAAAKAVPRDQIPALLGIAPN
ncbi:MAG: hypothetical protein QNJ65_08730 [Xenococcaceae cyanobacterium MO_234.B1]|nr:hypothetical protein [Xenococcaceae cyanobacterium MO_234.B1]